MRSMRRMLMAATITWLAVSTFAAFSPAATSPKDFVNGPAQWLMTREERAAWRTVKSDAEAQRFIDLFWARRDPTPGTPRNEFHEEFDSRVAISDDSLGTDKKRGALTDKGRVLILLGVPDSLISEAHRIHETHVVTTEGGGSGGHELAGKQTFTYPNGRQLGLTGDVYFFEDLRTHEYHFDPQRSNIAGAMASAVTRALISPDLKDVPEWATAKAIEASQYKLSIREVPKAAQVAGILLPPQPAGAGPLALLKDVMSLNPRGATSPLASAANVASFTKQDDLGYATNICVANYDPTTIPTIKVSMSITGESAGEKVRMTAPEEDFTPDAIKALPGCYLVRGSLPLADVGPGAYKLSLTLTDPTSQQKYNLEQPFKVE